MSPTRANSLEARPAANRVDRPAASTTIPIPREGRYTAQVTAGDSVNNTEFDVLFVGKKAEIAPTQKGSLH